MKKTLKELLSNYYLIPKDIDFINGIYCSNYEAEQMLKDLSVNEAYEKEILLEQTCIMNKKLTNKQVGQIKNDTRSYRQLSKSYNISLGTISKIKNNNY